MKHKKLIITLSVLGGTLLTIILAVVTCISLYKTSIKRDYKDFHSKSEVFTNMPGLDNNFVPQGIAYNETHNLFIVVGYDPDKNPSTLYIINEEGQMIKGLNVKLENGKFYTGHAGGVVSIEDKIYMSSGSKIYTLSVQKALDSSGFITCEAVTKVDVSGATIFNYNNYLFVTEFYEEKNYPTDETHHLVTPNNYQNKALAFGYEIDLTTSSGLKSNEPKVVISIPERIQGIVVKDNKIIMSQSYGRYNDSHILTYDNVLIKETNYTYSHNDKILPLYYIDESNLVESLKAPVLSEGICLYNGKIAIIFESGASKYRVTARCVVEDIYFIK